MDNETQQGMTARQRLAEISHHFLGDPEQADTTRSSSPLSRPFSIVLLDHQASLPYLELADALAKLDMTVSVSGNDGTTHAVFQPAADIASQSPSLPAIALHRHQDSLPGREEACDLVLLPVHASRQGLREAFIHVKKLDLHHQPVGVTIVGNPAQRMAEQCFNHFALAMHQFLQRRVVSFGFIASQCQTDLEPVAGLIQDEVRHWHNKILKLNKEKPEWTRRST